MGKIAEALRANLRELAQADARLLRELDAALPPPAAPPRPLAGHLADGLDQLSVKELRTLCKERAFKGCGSLNKAALVRKLRGEDTPQTSTAAPSPSPSTPTAIEARLDRMEALLQRIAERVGVVPEC